MFTPESSYAWSKPYPSSFQLKEPIKSVCLTLFVFEGPHRIKENHSLTGGGGGRGAGGTHERHKETFLLKKQQKQTKKELQT